MIIKEFQGEYRFLSNFYPAKVEFEHEIFPTVEHAYQAAKTKEWSKRLYIREARTPGEAKRRGRSISIREDWEDIKYDVMSKLVMDKFANNKELKQKLLNTRDSILQEGNKWGDKIWGIDLKTGKGLNLLGKILMIVRDTLKGV